MLTSVSVHKYSLLIHSRGIHLIVALVPTGMKAGVFTVTQFSVYVPSLAFQWVFCIVNCALDDISSFLKWKIIATAQYSFYNQGQVIMKKILLRMILFLWIMNGFLFAQEWIAPAILDSDVRTCPEYSMNLVGSSIVKQWTQISYRVESTVPVWEIATITHEFWNWPDVITTYPTSSATHVFEDQGTYLVKTLLTTSQWCTYVAQESIKVFERLFLYVWPWSDEYNLVKDSLNQENTYLWSVILAWDTLQNQEVVVESLLRNRGLIENADVLLIDSQALWVVLWAIPEVERVMPLTLDNANVYVLSSINQSAFRRLVATYNSIQWLKAINVVPQNNVWSLVSSLLLDKNPEELWIVKKFTTEAWSSRRMIISYFIDLLLVAWIPLQMIVMLLLVPIIAMVITFYRQVIWFTTYWVFTAMLLWLTIHIVWVRQWLLLLWIWWLTILTSWMITKRIYVLSSSKVAIKTCLYTIFLIIVLTIQYKYWMVTFDQGQLSNPYIVFPIYYILIASWSIFRDTWSLFKKKRFVGILQWGVVVSTVLLVLRWTRLQNTLLWYPDLILLALFCTFLLWRYTGLQATEYVRFMPLIMWTMNDHEEEE